MVASTFVTLRAIEVSAVPLVVISEPNAVSNESTDPSARKTKEAKAVSLVVSTALINETISANVSVLAPADNKIASILFFSVVIEVANEVSPEPLAVISPDKAVSKESIEAVCAVLMVSKEVIAVPWLVFTN